MKRLTEKIRENEYVTGIALIKELKIDYTNENKDYIIEKQKNIINTLNNKLGQIEDLMEKYSIPDVEYLEKCIQNHDKYGEASEQLGCPLEVVFKALKNGIWYEDVANRMTHIGVGLDTANYECEYLLREYDNVIRFLPRNYKKTWWLREDKYE